MELDRLDWWWLEKGVHPHIPSHSYDDDELNFDLYGLVCSHAPSTRQKCEKNFNLFTSPLQTTIDWINQRKLLASYGDIKTAGYMGSMKKKNMKFHFYFNSRRQCEIHSFAIFMIQTIKKKFFSFKKLRELMRRKWRRPQEKEEKRACLGHLNHRPTHLVR